MCKVTFGAEPTGQEIIEFVEKNLHKFEYSKGIEAKSSLETRKSPKRQLREAEKQRNFDLRQVKKKEKHKGH